MRYFTVDEDGDIRWTDDEEVAKQLSETDTVTVYYYDELLKILVRYGNVSEQYRMPQQWGISE